MTVEVSHVKSARDFHLREHDKFTDLGSWFLCPSAAVQHFSSNTSILFFLLHRNKVNSQHIKHTEHKGSISSTCFSTLKTDDQGSVLSVSPPRVKQYPSSTKALIPPFHR